MTHVPYKGSVPALNDVVAGHIPLMFSDLPPALPLINAGKVRALGVTTAQRLAAAPDVPPIADAIPGFDVAAWQMMSTRAGTPAAIVERLNAEMTAILAGADIRKQLIEMGLVPTPAATPAELQRFLESEIVRWGNIVHQAGIAGIE
jgi:tripartite-type tricarboxylate transporter receptor subunit TctC